MIYLASPYSDPDLAVQKYRYDLVAKATGVLLSAGHHVYSPIVHCHQIAIDNSLPTDAQFWRAYNEDMIDRCDSMFVLCIFRWNTSKGVMMEIEYAREIRMPVRYVNLLGEISSVPYFAGDV
jgi:hypothetical protein